MSDDQTHEVDEAPEADAPALSDLDFEELSALEDALIEEFEERSQVTEFSEDSMQELRDVVEALEMVREEAARRVEFAQLNELVHSTSIETFAEATDEITPDDENEDTVEEIVPEAEAEFAEATETPEADEVEDETMSDQPEQEFTVSDEATEAAEISPEGLESDSVPATPKRKLGITASADVPGYAAGQELGSMLEVAEALMAKRSHVRGSDRGNDGYQYLVASIPTGDYDEAHTLGNDAIINLSRIDEATKPEALTAAGGIKTILTPYYELTVFGDSVRPVRDALVGFKAERGGIQFIPAPVISTLSPGVNVYAESVDASATPYGSAGKGSVTVSAGSPASVKVDVIPRIMKVGNLMARTYPEMVAAWTKLLLAEHAREADGNILDKIVADSTTVSADAVYGGAVTLLGHLDQAVAGYRSRHRIASSVRFRAILPFWVKDLIRTDISRKQFGADYHLPDSAIESYFDVRGVNVTWHYDESASKSAIWAAQGGALGSGTGTALLKYGDVASDIVEWLLFPEGCWLFLDGGSLDLGLVRDSTLNSTNDYSLFAETFESAAHVGTQSLRVLSTIKATGSTSGPAASIVS